MRGCAAHLQIIKQQRRRKCFLNLHKYSLWELGAWQIVWGQLRIFHFPQVCTMAIVYICMCCVCTHVCMYLYDEHWTVARRTVSHGLRLWTVAKFNFTDGLYMKLPQKQNNNKVANNNKNNNGRQQNIKHK